jgi:VWFA-related protein
MSATPPHRAKLVATLAFAVPALLAAQEKGVPVFPSQVELITVDVVVTDKAGRPVRGLAAGDFVITEDGKAQDVASFEAIDLGDLAVGEPPPPSAVITNVHPSGARGRAFVILVDDLGLASANVPPLAAALSRIVRQAFEPGDEVTLGTTSGSFWWSVRWPDGREDLEVLLGRLQGRRVAESASDFISDWEAHQIDTFEGPGEVVGTSMPGTPAAAVIVPGADLTGRVVRRWIEANVCSELNPGGCAQLVRMRARERDAIRRERTRAVMAGVERAVFSLTGVRGRKELLFFSEGFLHDQDLAVVKQVAGFCREANLAVNFIDARGLVASTEESTAASVGRGPVPQEQALIELERLRFESEGSVGLAEDTGGLAVTGTNDLAGAARRIADESRVYYLLGYRLPPGKRSLGWRSVKVEVRRPGVVVRARKGYAWRPAATANASWPAAPPKSGAAVPVEISRALASSVDADGIPLRAMAYVFDELEAGKARVVMAVEADLRNLDFQTDGGKRRATIDFTIVATHRDTGAALRADKKIEVSAAASAPKGWSLFTQEFALAPGVTQARVVARDERSGRLGAVTVRFEVPPLGGLRLSTPILTDAITRSQRPEPVLVARRVFGPSMLYCQFQVFGAATGTDNTARVEASYVLRQTSGVELRSGQRTAIATVPGGPVMRLLGLRLDGVPGGDYELVLRIVDTTTGRTLERAEPFRLESSSP